MSPTILCADADRQLCRVLAHALGADGYRVVLAHDGEHALARVREAAPDLLVVELALPGRDGLALLREVRRLEPGHASPPALLLTTSPPSNDQIERARAVRASAILMKPVALEALGARVARLLARGRDAGAAEPGARPRPARATPLRGQLEHLPVPALLHQAHELRATGVLRLLCGARRKEIALVDGHPAAVRSNLPGERLGEWLLRSGRISRDDCAESIRRMHRGEGLQGEILVAMQALGEEELARALGEHAEEKLLQVFEWSEGSFELVLGAQLEHASALGHGRSPADWIRAGVRTRFPLVRIDAALRTHLGDVAVASANPFYSFQEIALGAEEKVLLREGERGVTVRALLARPAEQRRAAYTLLETGLLELRDGEAMRSGGPAPRVRLHLGAAPGRAAEARRTPAPEDAPAAAPAGTGPRAASGASARAARNAGAPTSTRRPPRAAPAPAAAAATEDDHSHYAADHEQRAALAALLERVRRASPFEKLGLLPDASDAEIRAAYMELAKQTHPDRYAGTSHVVRGLAEQAFREITRAYDLLCDPQQREAYRADPLRDARNTRAAAEGQRALEAEMAFQKGEARLRAYDWAGALAHFERAVELYPGEGEYLAYCGWSYYLAHGHDEEVLRKAFLMVKKGAKLAPDRDKPYLFLGRLCQAGGRLELAEKMFTRAVERRSDCTEALRELRLLAMRKPKQSLVTRLLRRPPGRRAGRGGG